MNHRENLKIVAFVGLAGSGKSTAVDHLTAKNYPKVYFGGIVLDEVKRRGLEPTQANEKLVREDLRATEGNDVLVKRIIQQIHDLAAAGQHRVIVDGLYSWTEYKAMKHEFPGEMTFIATITPKHVRKARLAKRPIRPLTSEEVDKRDWAEIENIEKGGPIAIADHFIMNSNDVEHFYHQIDDVLEHIRF